MIPTFAAETFGEYTLYDSRPEPAVGMATLRQGLTHVAHQTAIAVDPGYTCRHERDMAMETCSRTYSNSTRSGAPAGRIADDDLDARMATQPGGEHVGGAIVEQIDRPTSLEVDQRRSVATWFAAPCATFAARPQRVRAGLPPAQLAALRTRDQYQIAVSLDDDRDDAPALRLCPPDSATVTPLEGHAGAISLRPQRLDLSSPEFRESPRLSATADERRPRQGTGVVAATASRDSHSARGPCPRGEPMPDVPHFTISGRVVPALLSRASGCPNSEGRAPPPAAAQCVAVHELIAMPGLGPACNTTRRAEM